MQGAIDAAGDNRITHVHKGYVWMIASVAALGGLLFGYDWVVIGGARPFYEKYFGLESEVLIGWATSCALLGCLLGSVISAPLSDKFGRKVLLVLVAALFGVTSIFTGLATDFNSFIFWRILGGVAIGISSNISPTYISEISPASMRGRLVTLNQIAIVIGIVAAQLVNLLIAQPVPPGASDALIQASWNGQTGWRWMFFAVAAPSVLFFFSALFIPESPRWLEMKGRHKEARRILRRIGAPEPTAAQIAEIEQSFGHQPKTADQLRALFSQSFRPILVIAICLTVLQQWSGINIIFTYADEVYTRAGYEMDAVLFNIVVTGAVNLLFTLIALVTVDRFGRRGLMLIGTAGLALSHFALGLSYVAGLTGAPILFATLAAVGIYGLSLAPLTWVLINEIFPTPLRALGVSIAVSALWIASFILTFTFPMLDRYLGSAGTFWLYAGICFSGFVFVWRRIPETKGRDMEEISMMLRAKNRLPVSASAS